MPKKINWKILILSKKNQLKNPRKSQAKINKKINKKSI